MRKPEDGGDRDLAHKLAYRPDLDGLRGIAVAAIVACHLDAHLAPGGFVGVDVFFVLSGFLIAGLIAADLEADRFSLVEFYQRRFRRIVPALVFVLACCTVLALFILLPIELRNYSRSLVAAVLSASNIWWATHTGYFAPSAETQPLMHTWSLGVEEQFYLLFPLILATAFRRRREWVGSLIWSLFALSLAASIVLLGEYPNSVFFLLHTRAWELLAGSVLALGLVPAPRSALQRELGGALGLLAIAIAVYAYESTTPFPGAAALVPCIGAALIIWSGQGSTFVARLLSVRPLVFIGLISYSLYLWHWPLIVFTRILIDQPLGATEQVALASASLLLATLTWWFVERPFRRRGESGFSPRAVVWSGGLGIGSLAVCGVTFAMLHGLPGRYPKEVSDLALGALDSSPLRARCHFNNRSTGAYDTSCVIGASVAPKIIVYGDSHGAELAVALGTLAEARGASVREITSSGCPPALGYVPSDRSRCAEYNADIVKRLTSIAPATIILTANSAGWPLQNDQRWPGLKAVITALKSAGHRVIVYGPVPNPPGGVPIPSKLARWAATGHDPKDYAFDPDMAQLRGVEARLKEMASQEHAIYLPISQVFCSQVGCKPYLDGTILYLDNSHLSVSGARLMATKLLVPMLWPEAGQPQAASGAALQPIGSLP